MMKCLYGLLRLVLLGLCGHGPTVVSEGHAGLSPTLLHTARLPRIPDPEPMA